MNIKAEEKQSDVNIHDMVSDNDHGARKPLGVSATIIAVTALIWSLLQLWVASPLPYMDFFSHTLGIPTFSGNTIRYLHLSFGMFLALLCYPFIQTRSRTKIPVFDWVLAIAAVFCIMVLYFEAPALAKRVGRATDFDIAIAVCGVLILLEATRRVLGSSLVIIAILLLVYSYYGNGLLIPDIIATKGHSMGSVAYNQWLSTEGVFGISLAVSAEFIFLFVLFGALLERTGAGNYFIQLAFSLVGHMRGGPAKAAVLSSALTGLISGSSIANVVTTGTFTIPMMRRAGYSREQAGAIEVSSAVDSQLLPPIMGTAAFLIAEYVGVNYVEVVKAAFLPAILSYISLIYIVHLEAVKADMKVITRDKPRPLFGMMLMIGITVSSIIILAGIAYYVIGWVKLLTGDYSHYAICTLLFAAYIGLIKYSSKYPSIAINDPNDKKYVLPETGKTFKTGTHYILPIIVLIWCMMVENLSPGTSVFWAICSVSFILVTQKPLMEFFRNSKSNRIKKLLKIGFRELFESLVTGAKNMTSVAIATGSAGIIVGAITFTGLGQGMTEIVELISGGSFALILVFTAVFCLVLGAGLPTTATYIVVASLMAPVIRELGMQHGMDIPLVAIHLFVFYFGLMADVTPPVGLASFAAAAISGGDPMKTGWQGTVYSMRTAILPFIFMYNTDLLLIGVDTVWEFLYILIKGTIAALIFTAATQGFFITRNKIYETVLLLLVVFAMLRPGYINGFFYPEYSQVSARNIEQVIMEAEVGKIVKLDIFGLDNFGDDKEFIARVKVPDGKTAKERLKKYGIVLDISGGNVTIKQVIPDSEAEKRGFFVDDTIKYIEKPNQQPNKNWVVIAGMIILAGVIFLQNRRKAVLWQVS